MSGRGHSTGGPGLRETRLSEAKEVVALWFGREGDPGYGERRDVWFAEDEGFDREIRERFADDYERAAEGGLDHWEDAPRSSLALILLLDQVPRNLFRGDPRSFATDDKALSAARRTLERGFDRDLAKVMRWFVYLPFEHSENLEDQHRSAGLFRALGDDPDSAYVVDYALRHREVVERFGRFPHRNEVLGRPSTPEEAEFLKKTGLGFLRNDLTGEGSWTTEISGYWGSRRVSGTLRSTGASCAPPTKSVRGTWPARASI